MRRLSPFVFVFHLSLIFITVLFCVLEYIQVMPLHWYAWLVRFCNLHNVGGLHDSSHGSVFLCLYVDLLFHGGVFRLISLWLNVISLALTMLNLGFKFDVFIFFFSWTQCSDYVVYSCLSRYHDKVYLTCDATNVQHLHS